MGSTIDKTSVPSLSKPPSSAVSETRLWERHQTIAQYGAVKGGGVNRAALSVEEIGARTKLMEWSLERDYRVFMDDIGNMFVRRDGTKADAPPILTGSHLDSQPGGGNFDGVYGVLAGLEVLDALSDLNAETLHPVEVVVWTNEEGVRFDPGTMGSAAFAGSLPLDQLLQVKDAEGISVEAAVGSMRAALTKAEHRPVGMQTTAYIEAHIEQGPVLEEAAKTIGVVTGIQSARWLKVRVLGESGHAGTTPRRLRKDAFETATRIGHELFVVSNDPEDMVRFTIGRVHVSPGSPSVIPNLVELTIDMRHPDPAVLVELGRKIDAVCNRLKDGCTTEIVEILDNPAVIFDPNLLEYIDDAADALGLPSMRLMSGADHDAKLLNLVCPTAMIFVPCSRGLSHTKEEMADPSDLAGGARVLADVITTIDGSLTRAGPIG